MYIELRRRVWHALHTIPAPARVALGKPRFCQSLKTGDRALALQRAASLEAEWRAEIQRVMGGAGVPWAYGNTPMDEVEARALAMRRAMRQAETPARQHDIWLHAGEEAAEIDNTGGPVAARYLGIVDGKLVPFLEHLDDYLGTLKCEPKSVDMKRSTIKKFAAGHRVISDVDRKKVQGWVNRQAGEGKAVATIRRSLSELRGYWSYLVAIQEAPEGADPFDKLHIPRAGKSDYVRRAFAPADVVRLYGDAVAAGDGQLADLIELAMWTGARIEELCALKVADATPHVLRIADAKTDAGNRDVPVHDQLRDTVHRLIVNSADGYLVSGLVPNKYGDRAGALGKRFGRLKTAAGFGPAYVFHSIRKTVSTLFENAHVPEGVAADILGHEKPTMTYGLYSGGASMATKRDAMAKLDYPSALDAMMM